MNSLDIHNITSITENKAHKVFETYAKTITIRNDAGERFDITLYSAKIETLEVK